MAPTLQKDGAVRDQAMSFRFSIQTGGTTHLAELDVTPTELSRQLAVPPNRITQIIQGKRAITGDTALRLGHWFRTSAHFWLNLQSACDLDLAVMQIGSEVARLPTRPAIAEEAASL